LNGRLPLARFRIEGPDVIAGFGLGMALQAKAFIFNLLENE
jgi:hypothetical protein